MGKVNKRPERLMSLKLIAVFRLLLETDWLSQIKEIQDLKITLCITSWGFCSGLVSMGYEASEWLLYALYDHAIYDWLAVRETPAY